MAHGYEKIKIKKYKEGVPPGGKRAYEESMARDKISDKGNLAKESLVVDREKKIKKHVVIEKIGETWQTMHDETCPLGAKGKKCK